MKPGGAAGGGAESATAFAPATVANVAVGFDILGDAVESVGDRVTVTKTAEPTVTLREAMGLAAFELERKEPGV